MGKNLLKKNLDLNVFKPMSSNQIELAVYQMFKKARELRIILKDKHESNN